MSESLYFIGIVPPLKIQEEITQLKVLMAERFNSKHALNSPPHITLHMPFKWKKNRMIQLKSAVHKMNSELQPFEIQLDGFGFFEPRVVYVNLKNSIILNEFQKQVVNICRRDLKLDNGNYKDRPFKPHMTIGFRDLRKPQFYEAKKYFEKRAFSDQFKVDRIELLLYKKGKWSVAEIF